MHLQSGDLGFDPPGVPQQQVALLGRSRLPRFRLALVLVATVTAALVPGDRADLLVVKRNVGSLSPLRRDMSWIVSAAIHAASHASSA